MKEAGLQSPLQMCPEEAVQASCPEAPPIRLLLFEPQPWYEFPGAALTKYLTCGGFKQQKFTWKQPKCLLTDEWLKKMWYIYTTEYYSAIKKNETWPLATMWRQLKMIMLSEVSQKEKDRYHDITYISYRL